MNEVVTEVENTEISQHDYIENCTGIYLALAQLPPRTPLTEDALARLLGKGCRETIKRAVEANELPRPFKFRGKNLWISGMVLDFFEERVRDNNRKDSRGRSYAA